MSREEITHKELLSFSNLTNLSWEFVDLEGIKNGDEPVGGEEYESDEYSTQLDDLLTPEVFEREYDDEETTEYKYGANDNGELISEEAGLKDMREEAGIAMEYLDKCKDEDSEVGDFLEEWEVIYAGDRYKILRDYLDEREEIINELLKELVGEELEESIYPSRSDIEENVEKAKEQKLKIKYITKAIGSALTVKSAFFRVKSSGARKKMTEIISKEIGEEVIKKAFEESVKVEFDLLSITLKLQ